MAPQATVILPGFEMAGKSAALTVMVLETAATVLPQTSVAVQVSVMVPPQAPGAVVKVEDSEVPEIRHTPLKPLLKVMVLGGITVPQSIVIGAGAVMVGSAAGLTVIVLETAGITLPQASVAVHVSVTVPPQALGVGENADRLDVPDIRHPPLNPLVYGRVLGAGMAPQATVIFPGFDMAGSVAGEPVIS